MFTIPTNFIKIFNRDLKLAGIPKRDERGRTLDIHALRTTFGTLLSKGGVPLRTAQAAMRHSDPSLTANVYTDPKLLDVAGSLDALPKLPLAGRPGTDAEDAPEIGQSPTGQARLALPLAPTPCKPGASESIAGNSTVVGEQAVLPASPAATAEPVRGRGPLSAADNRMEIAGDLGFEDISKILCSHLVGMGFAS